MKKINNYNYKKALSQFATGITVVLVKDRKLIKGVTVNSFNSLSLEPPLVLFSLGNNSSSIRSFLNTKSLSINILSSKQKNISNLFSTKDPNFRDIKFFEGENDSVFLKDCMANLECKLVQKIKKGDHRIFICRVLRCKISSNLKPLIYYNSEYY